MEEVKDAVETNEPDVENYNSENDDIVVSETPQLTVEEVQGLIAVAIAGLSEKVSQIDEKIIKMMDYSNKNGDVKQDEKDNRSAKEYARDAIIGGK